MDRIYKRYKTKVMDPVSTPPGFAIPGDHLLGWVRRTDSTVWESGGWGHCKEGLMERACNRLQLFKSIPNAAPFWELAAVLNNNADAAVKRATVLLDQLAQKQGLVPFEICIMSGQSPRGATKHLLVKVRSPKVWEIPYLLSFFITMVRCAAAGVKLGFDSLADELCRAGKDAEYWRRLRSTIRQINPDIDITDLLLSKRFVGMLPRGTKAWDSGRNSGMINLVGPELMAVAIQTKGNSTTITELSNVIKFIQNFKRSE